MTWRRAARRNLRMRGLRSKLRLIRRLKIRLPVTQKSLDLSRRDKQRRTCSDSKKKSASKLRKTQLTRQREIRTLPTVLNKSDLTKKDSKLNDSLRKELAPKNKPARMRSVNAASWKKSEIRNRRCLQMHPVTMISPRTPTRS